jgi:hypothetical protein
MLVQKGEGEEGEEVRRVAGRDEATNSGEAETRG